MYSLFEKAIQNQDYFEDFITRNVYHSNSIEGNTISYGETHALIFNQEDFIVKAKPREIYEAINLKYAMDYVLKNKDNDISESRVKDIGRIINKNVKEISGYRTEAVFINGAEHIPLAPDLVNQGMINLLYKIEHKEYESIMERCADFHIQFERIHPFSDGNGSTGRALNTLFLLKENQTPFVIPLENRPEYFKFLADQDVKGLAGLFEKLQRSEEKRILVFCPELKE